MTGHRFLRSIAAALRLHRLASNRDQIREAAVDGLVFPRLKRGGPSRRFSGWPPWRRLQRDVPAFRGLNTFPGLLRWKRIHAIAVRAL